MQNFVQFRGGSSGGYSKLKPITESKSGLSRLNRADQAKVLGLVREETGGISIPKADFKKAATVWSEKTGKPSKRFASDIFAKQALSSIHKDAFQQVKVEKST